MRYIAISMLKTIGHARVKPACSTSKERCTACHAVPHVHDAQVNVGAQGFVQHRKYHVCV